MSTWIRFSEAHFVIAVCTVYYFALATFSSSTSDRILDFSIHWDDTRDKEGILADLMRKRNCKIKDEEHCEFDS